MPHLDMEYFKQYQARREEILEAMIARLGYRKAAALNAYSNVLHSTGVMLKLTAREPILSKILDLIAETIISDVFSIISAIDASDDDLDPKVKGLSPQIEAWMTEINAHAETSLKALRILESRMRKP